ncbi:MAG: rhodanese-like domain-containing protein [Limisphaerales bacterium]
MNTSLLCRWFCCSTLAFGATALAISFAEVQRRLDAGETITFVDVRANAFFQKGHIPGAINIPGGLVSQKNLPPLGRVVVYDDGLGHNAAEVAVSALNQKLGITAEVLDGGFATWEMAQAATTRGGGMKPEELPLITYAQLKEAPSGDVVLVDLRQVGPDSAGKSALAASQPALTDLRAEFPNVRVTRSAFAVPAAKKTSSPASSASPPLLVLIDSGNGAAQATARALKANGVKRFVILVGGEEILARKGQPGLQRAGSTVTLQRSLLPQ